MRKLLPLIIAALAINFSYSQSYADSPWLKQLTESTSEAELQQKNSNQPFTFHEVQEAFNQYWENRDPSIKGSGNKSSCGILLKAAK